MRLGRKHRDYWRRNLKLTASLLAVWFVVTFVVSYFARDLADHRARLSARLLHGRPGRAADLPVDHLVVRPLYEQSRPRVRGE
jgi:hypothetical protein